MQLDGAEPARAACAPGGAAGRGAGAVQGRAGAGKQGQCVDPRSLNQLALLQVRHGDTIRLIADGAQADEALAAFKALAEQHFGETVSERQQPSLHGIPVAESVTSGPVFRAHCFWPPTVDRRIGADEVLGEQQRLREALQHTLSDLNRLAERTGTLIGKPQAAIFGAHSMLLDDPDLQQAAYTRIAQQLCCAEQARRQVLEAIAEEYRELDDDYMRARELDVRDMLRRTLCHLQAAAAGHRAGRAVDTGDGRADAFRGGDARQAAGAWHLPQRWQCPVAQRHSGEGDGYSDGGRHAGLPE